MVAGSGFRIQPENASFVAPTAVGYGSDAKAPTFATPGESGATLFCPYSSGAPVIDIIIPSFNCVDLLTAAIESVRSGTELGWKAYVIDNASEDGAREWLRQQPDLEVVYNDTNEGFSKATNTGIALSMRNPMSQWTVLMNNDVVVPKGWDKKMLKALKKHGNRRIKICSPLLFKPRGKHTIGDQAKRAIKRWGKNSMVDADWVGFCCTFVHKRVWQRYGLLRDDRRFWHWGSDEEFCRRVLPPYGSDGWRCCYYTGVGVMHFHSAARKYVASKKAKERRESQGGSQGEGQRCTR